MKAMKLVAVVIAIFVMASCGKEARAASPRHSEVQSSCPTAVKVRTGQVAIVHCTVVNLGDQATDGLTVFVWKPVSVRMLAVRLGDAQLPIRWQSWRMGTVTLPSYALGAAGSGTDSVGVELVIRPSKTIPRRVRPELVFGAVDRAAPGDADASAAYVALRFKKR